jgi:hypothetical protein
MRTLLLGFLTMGLVGCGTETTSGTAADTSTADATGDTTTGTDASGADGAGTDAATLDTVTSDSPWKGTVFVNEINAGGSKTPTIATDADWIELYNTGSSELDLTGCKLGGITNGLAGADPVPAGTKIPAKGFLVVYYNHMNLGVPVLDAGIKSDGSMGLWDKDGLMVDFVDWNEGASPAGSSYDRTPDGTATWATVTPPTPGKPNSK